jgi:hypothetical protein
VIHLAWVAPFTTKSDTARSMADYVAAAASRGLLTTHLGSNEYSRSWHPTPEGLMFARYHLPNPPKIKDHDDASLSSD